MPAIGIGLGPGNVAVQRPPSEAPSGDLFPQGALADPTQWTLVNGTGISISGGKMVFAATAGTAIMRLTGSMLAQLNAGLAQGTIYNVSVVVSGWSAGSTAIRLLLGPTSGLNISGDGVFQSFVTSGVGTFCQFQASNGSTFNIDSISVME